MSWLDSQQPILALAPMADMTDSPFCRICREEAGSGFVIFREMVSSEAIIRDSAKTLKMCEFDKIERPIVVQLFGSKPDTIRTAARIIVDRFHPDGIDINMGCPVPKITGKVAAGAALMKKHDIAVEIVKELKRENLGVPITIKTRLGWSDPNDILEFAPKLEQAGADAISIHGRTKTQGYSGKANWEMIGETKKSVKIPVIANGDIVSTEDVRKCLEVTNADGVMIGRGALGNPWIFANSSRLLVPSSQLIDVVLRHAKYHIERYGEKSMATFRKHLAYYFRGSKNKEQKIALMRVSSVGELALLLDNQLNVVE